MNKMPSPRRQCKVFFASVNMTKNTFLDSIYQLAKVEDARVVRNHKYKYQSSNLVRTNPNKSVFSKPINMFWYPSNQCKVVKPVELLHSSKNKTLRSNFLRIQALFQVLCILKIIFQVRDFCVFQQITKKDFQHCPNFIIESVIGVFFLRL